MTAFISYRNQKFTACRRHSSDDRLYLYLRLQNMIWGRRAGCWRLCKTIATPRILLRREFAAQHNVPSTSSPYLTQEEMPPEPFGGNRLRHRASRGFGNSSSRHRRRRWHPRRLPRYQLVAIPGMWRPGSRRRRWSSSVVSAASRPSQSGQWLSTRGSDLLSAYCRDPGHGEEAVVVVVCINRGPGM